MTEQMLRQYTVLVEYLGKTLGPPDGIAIGARTRAVQRAAHRRALAFTGRDGSSCAASQASMAERR